MEIVILLAVVVLVAVPASLVTTFAVIWHEQRRILPPARPIPSTVDTPALSH